MSVSNIIMVVMGAVLLTSLGRPAKTDQKETPMKPIGDDPYRPSYEIEYVSPPPTLIERIHLFFRALFKRHHP